MQQKMSNQSVEVDQFISRLRHPLKEEIETIRTFILASNKEITEHIKWKAPSFCYNGDDRVTFNLHARDHIKIIFHRGAKVKDSKESAFNDDTDLLEWLTDDRAVIKFQNMTEVKIKKAALVTLVKRWMKATVDTS